MYPLSISTTKKNAQQYLVVVTTRALMYSSKLMKLCFRLRISRVLFDKLLEEQQTGETPESSVKQIVVNTNSFVDEMLVHRVPSGPLVLSNGGSIRRQVEGP